MKSLFLIVGFLFSTGFASANNESPRPLIERQRAAIQNILNSNIKGVSVYHLHVCKTVSNRFGCNSNDPISGFFSAISTAFIEASGEVMRVFNKEDQIDGHADLTVHFDDGRGSVYVCNGNVKLFESEPNRVESAWAACYQHIDRELDKIIDQVVEASGKYGYRCSELDDPRVLEQTPNTTIETQEVLLSRIAERVAARYGVNEFDKESLISFIKSYILDNYSIDTLEVIGPFGLDETHSYMTYIKTVDGGSWNKKHQMACIKRKSNYRTIFVESKNFDL